jgi:hypothetical protein
MAFSTEMLAGEGFAGLPLLQEDPPQRLTYPTQARQFDGKTGGYTLDANGAWRRGHPVDQGMALSLCMRLGSIKSAPEVGHRLHTVQVGTPRTQLEVELRVRASYPCSRYLADGLVQIERITHAALPGGGLAVAVHYKNLATQRTEVARNT